MTKEELQAEIEAAQKDFDQKTGAYDEAKIAFETAIAGQKASLVILRDLQKQLKDIS